MIQTLFFAFALLFFGGCSASKLQLQNDNVSLRYDDDTLRAEGRIIYSDKKFLPPITVKRSVFETDGGKRIVFESAYVQSGYVFYGSVAKSIDTVFDAAKIERLAAYGNLFFYRLTLRDNAQLYLVAQNRNKKALLFAYGLGGEDFAKVIKQVTGKEISLQGEALQGNEAQTLICSKWSQKMLLLDNLVTKTGGRVKVKK